MTVHRGVLRRETRPVQLAKLRAAGHQIGEGVCALCGAALVFTVADHLEAATLLCRRCCNDTLTSYARQQRPVAIVMPSGVAGVQLVSHDHACPAPRGGSCQCEPDVTVAVTSTAPRRRHDR